MSRPYGALATAVMLVSSALGGCAGQQCDFHSQCGEQHYCSLGRCLQDCRRDFDCDRGERCSEIGQCVAPDGHVAVPDAFVPTPDAFVPMPDAFVPPPHDGGRDAGRDAGMDAARDMDAGRDAGVEADAGTDASSDAGVDAGRDAGPTPASTYSYRRLAIGGLREAVAVSFHPNGSYAIVLERSDAVHVVDWASETATRVDVRVSGRTVYLQDVELAADGSAAWIVGYERVGTADTGVVIVLDDARWRAGDGASAFSRAAATAAGERFTGIERPRASSGGPAGDGRPVVVSQSGSSPYVARLRELDVATGAFGGLFVARATSAGCDDLAFADNEFGGWGIVLACGTNGAEAPYYTTVGGVGEWRASTSSLGNVSRAASHPSGAYALLVNHSSRWLHRFEAGALRPTSTSPGLASGIYDVSLSPDGALALVVGRAIGSPLRGTVFEYRHDLWSAVEITDVSIEGFDAAPYLATTSTYLQDSAFHPACDGGLIVGGHSSFSGSTGLVIRFDRDAGRPCAP